MKVITVCLFFLLLMSGCNSPMNNRVQNKDRKKSLGFEKLLFKQPSLKVEIKWLKGPFANIHRNNHLLVLIYKDGLAFSLAKNHTLEFYATMPSMAHPMEDSGYFEEIDHGLYINKSIRYNMSGDWRNELWIMDSNSNITDKLEWQESF